MNPYIFREYDIRGIVDKDLTDDVVYRLARGFGTYFKQRGVNKISLGYDCRLSSEGFRNILVNGLIETGCNIYDLGMIPTPLLYFSLFNLDVDGGVQITGSHNPPDNNGFKICLHKSTIYGDEIQRIRRIVEDGNFYKGTGSVSKKDIITSYKEYILNNLSIGNMNRNKKIIVDAGNGVGGLVAVPIYRKFGFDVIELFCEPDGRFPNHHPDPTIVKNMKKLIEKVREKKAHLGIAFDGDADRIGVVDEKGEIIWGDQLMIIFSRAILKELKGAKFIGEVKCSQTLFDDIRKNGGVPIMWKVGHSLIKAKMREEEAVLAGEMSGHIFFSHKYFGYDDAIYAGARLLEILSNTDKSISELLSGVPKMVSTPEIRIECPDEKKFEIVKMLTEDFKNNHEVIDIDGARIIFDDGWGLVRASNTQPVLVLRFEGKSEDSLKNIKNEIESRLKYFIQKA
jgi:phosphomannomutase/phosphoglucomutase